MSLRKKVVSGVLWTALSNIGGTLLSFTLGVWLARLLGPSAYGLIGMVLVIAGFGRLLLDFGFGEALIQKQNVTEQDYSSVFWFNLAVAIFLSIAFYISAPWIADFYKNEKLVDLSRIMSLSFLLNGCIIVQRIRLEKAFRYKVISLAEITSTLVSTLLAIAMAYKGYGVWSLVGLHLSKPLLYALLIWLASKWLPVLQFHKSSIRGLGKFSISILVNGIFNTLATSLDKILIGRNLGANNFGLYSKAYGTLRLPVNQLTYAMNRVLYPAFSQIQHQRKHVFEVYGKIISLISLLIFPVMLAFVFFGDTIIWLMFGREWAEMIPVFRILALTAGFIPFNIIADSIIKSQGSSYHLNLITFVEKPLVILAVVIGIWLGSITTLSWCLTAATLVVFMFKGWLISAVLEQPYPSLLHYHAQGLKYIALPLVTLLTILTFQPDLYVLIAAVLFVLALIISIVIYRKSVWSLIREIKQAYQSA